VDALAGKPAQGLAVGFGRVSSRRQQGDGDLDRQVARLRAWAGGELSVITDVASGLSERRAGLRKVLGQGLVKTKRLRVVVIAETAGGGP